MSGSLAAAAAHAATTLPREHTLKLAKRLEQCGGDGLPPQGAASADVATSAFAEEVARLWQAWRSSPAVSTAVVAGMLRGAVATAERLDTRRLDAVVTGPASMRLPLRSTAAIVSELIAGARSELLLASFAAVPPQSLLTSLQAALDRGVALTLLLETIDKDGSTTWAAPYAFAELHGNVTILCWPPERRPASAAQSLPRMHAKLVVADRRRALVTSANLTGHALDLNIEVGVRLERGDVPRQLSEHVQELRAAGELSRWP
jgi:phosphatidylserine/phosphatidylglycerophosphate/cardiolipin synthase-like enzyme